MRFRWFVLGVLGFSITIEANAASFDCAKAISRIDNTICASPKVSKLDNDLAVAYKDALRNSADQDGVKTAQRAWLKQTRNTCLDEACLITVYQQRIAALNASVPMGNPSREETELDDANIPTEAELKAREQISASVATTPGNTSGTGSLASGSPVSASAPASEAPATSAAVAPPIQPSAPATSNETKQSTSASAEPRPQMAEKKPVSSLSMVVALLVLALLVAGLVWFIRKRLLPGMGKLSGQLVNTAKGMSAVISDARAEFREGQATLKEGLTKEGLSEKIPAEQPKFKNMVWKVLGVAALMYFGLNLMMGSGGGHSTKKNGPFDRNEAMAITPMFSDLGVLRFGDPPERLPSNFTLVHETPGETRKRKAMARENGSPLCDLYRSTTSRTELQRVPVSNVNICFADGRLFSVVAFFNGQENYRKIISHVASLVGEKGEKDRFLDGAYVWHRTINGMRSKVNVSLVGPGVAYIESLEHTDAIAGKSGISTIATRSDPEKPVPTKKDATEFGPEPLASERTDPVDTLRNAFRHFDSRCMKIAGQSTFELLRQVENYRRSGGNNNVGMGSVQGQLAMLRNIGCAPRP